jgi:parvulin-like peptidyl-prolyl isomerase
MKLDYAGGSILPEEVVKYLFLAGLSRPILIDMVKNREVMKKAAELGLRVADEQLQEFCDNYRNVRGLSSRQSTLRFFQSAGLTEDDFEAHCEAAILAPLVKDHLADAELIENYFVDNRSEFDRARVSIIHARDENLANEIHLQATEDGEDFHVLARRFSADETTRYAGGYMGMVTRDTFSPGISAKVFSAAPGDVVGPFKGNEIFILLAVEEVIKAQLTDEVRQAIKDRIFDEWLAQSLRRGIVVNP